MKILWWWVTTGRITPQMLLCCTMKGAIIAWGTGRPNLAGGSGLPQNMGEHLVGR